MVLLWSAVMITLQTQFSQSCWTGALVWYGPIKRQRFSSREEWTASHLRMGFFQRWSGASLQCLWSYCLWFLCCCRWDSLFFFSFCAPASLTKQTLISLHLCAGALWKLMNCRDRLVVFALLEASMWRGRTLEPVPEIKSSTIISIKQSRVIQWIRTTLLKYLNF